ncbi:DUF488 domain-containing protein [Bradyrhizobium canariense]|uniref:Uncharacterized conserved protein YeaO, DUF488 family n=1 Tax=Bradyrhizobium canariense TaxID=255045 RepID=A0A1H1UDF6_9BRAD|nr:DUF488 domain-containing protein [Bradyrhizobium canariense]SDS70458.1 Uncharacterized conserved protein YeaO, DUF488 family [Bradyrhizobium canariense]
MPTLHIKRVYERPSPEDGVRILVDRLWPRGLTKEAAALDYWCKDIAPSPELRKWFDHREDRFDEFRRRYRLELKSNPSLPEFRKLAKPGKATLLYAAHDAKVNHAVVLAEYIQALKAKAPPKRRSVRKS